MKRLIFSLLFLLGMGAAPAMAAQCDGVFGNGSLCGSLSGGVAKQIGGIIINYPIIHPVITNSGAAGAHSLLWNDNNWTLSNDEISMNSSDPSALLSFTPTGTPGNGTSTLTFTFGSGACAGGCTASTTTTNAQSLATVVANLVTAIKANANLYNNVAGSQGQILAVSSASTTLSLDFNSNVGMMVTFSDTASAITSHLPVSCATACNAALDVNPQFTFGRASGAAPVAGSQVGSIEWGGTSSGAPTTINTVYGQLAIKALNSTTSSIQGQVGIIAGNSAAADALYVSNGICTAATATSAGCAGVDTLIMTGFFGGTAAGATPVFKSTTNGSPNNDTLTLEASKVIVRGYSGSGELDCGIANTVSCLFVAAGSSTGSQTWKPAAAASGVITWPAGTVDFSATGGSGQFVKQASSGGIFTVTQPACADISNAGTTCTINTGTSGATVPLLNAASNTWGGNQVVAGQIFSTTGLPTIASGACGATTNGAVVSGSTNQSGQITIGSAATTTCTISWSGTLAQAPNACVFFPMNAAAAATGTTVARVAAPTTGGVVLSGSALANANYAYVCI